MLFNSIDFIVFFNLLLLLLFFVKQNKNQKFIFLLASYIFYMWWNPAFILLIILSTVIDYFLGQKIYAAEKKKNWLILSIMANLGILGFFKYFGFFEDNLFLFMQWFGYEPSWVSLNIILPVGISFYTFQTMSYSIDIYRGNLQPSKSPLDFAVFVAFFPQLVAGPIVRASEFLPQLEQERKLDFSKLNMLIILKGLFKKVIIADNLGFFVESIYTQPELYPSVIIWVAAICFSIQIYCDFSGYTDIAIGVAAILGFKFPTNFDKPYFAITPSDFWRRWHITLSSWLRDYLYISMGGNKKGTWKTYRNLALTMLLGGLWHGASWNFVLWGALHGTVLVFYRIFNIDKRLKGLKFTSIPVLISYVSFQFYVIVTWITFRLVDFDKMQTALYKFLVFDFNFSLANSGLGTKKFFTTLILLSLFFLVHTYSYAVKGIENRINKVSWNTIYASLAIGALVFYFFIPSNDTPFIYFQF
jgi:D-alanyl-lipoteichoic acid acyltransferase DltB (MBOAT superfamily)